MGQKGRLIIANHTIVDALPWQRSSSGYADQIWKYRRKLKLSDPVSREVARAHCELVQNVCAEVREKPRGPRGGRGAMHYNGEPQFGEWWPSSWNHASKSCTFFLVTEVMSKSPMEVQRERAILSVDPGVDEGLSMPMMVIDEYSKMHYEQEPGMPEFRSEWPKPKVHDHQLDAYSYIAQGHTMAREELTREELTVGYGATP